VQIAIISDTHMPRDRRRLPPACQALLRESDLIVHAGDFASLSVLHQLESYGAVVAVHGNVDDAGLRVRLPSTTLVEAGRARIGLVHDAGPARGRIARMRGLFPDAEAVVFGHSHLPLHDRAPDGFQIFNPGSPTERRRAQAHTMGLARVHGGRIDFELVTLVPAARPG
jgi:putative phosphoesterase